MIPDFAWDEQDAFFERFRTGADALEMRDNYQRGWAMVLGRYAAAAAEGVHP